VTGAAAWLVDLDGTLYRAPPVKMAMAAEVMVAGWAAIETLRVFRQQHELMRELASEGLSPYRIQIERTAERLGVGADRVESIVSEWMHARPGKWIRMFRRQSLLDEIVRYKASGGLVALVSDYPATTKLAALGAVELFTVVVANGEPGGPRRLKPDPEGYLSAAERLGVAPESCLVLGDRSDADGAAASAAGMAFRKV
jgi:phosphoglycolate phosphatase/putative hydrolase of the HAD superfamily